MTRQQMWQTIAEAFHTPPDDRTIVQQDIAQFGLCAAIDEIAAQKSSISNDVWEMADRVIRAFAPPNRYSAGYYLPYERVVGEGFYIYLTGWEIRGDFAVLMSCLTDKEYEGLARSCDLEGVWGEDV